MRITEFISPEPTSSISTEDEARIIDTVQQGESAWSKPMTLEEAIAATLKATQAA
jgi:hypothetical protein